MADGKPVARSFSVKLDGTPAPMTGSRNVDMISVRKIDDHTITAKTTKGGKLEGESGVTVSQDGKVLTWRGSGVDAKGVKHESVIDYDK
jgi:hypothetical protein